MTAPVQVRPEAPRRLVTLLGPLAIVSAGFFIGGFVGDLLGGVIWGVIGGISLIIALHLAGEEPDPIDMALLFGAAIAATVLTNLLLPEAPDALTPNLSMIVGAAWLPAGAGVAAVVWRKTSSPAKAFTVVLIWAGAGMLALPVAVAYGALEPLAYVVGEPDAFSTWAYATIGLSVGFVGGASILSSLTGLNGLASVSIVAFTTVYAMAQVGFTIPGLIRNFSNMGDIAKMMWPPDFGWAIGTGDWWWVPSWDFGSELRANPLMETFRIAIIACLTGVTLAIPLAFRASKMTAIRGNDYWLNKAIMNVIRTIPDLFWAMIFAASVGIGPFAGTLALIFFSLAIMAKLLSETIDAVDPRPIEASRATGAHHWPAMKTAVWPQVLPNYIAYALYIFEINIRASVVLGIVGAGGIGRVLEAQRSFFRFDRVMAIVVVIFVIVFLIEQVSVALRRRLV